MRAYFLRRFVFLSGNNWFYIKVEAKYLFVFSEKLLKYLASAIATDEIKNCANFFVNLS